MIIEPKAKGFICITAHPTGCAANVNAQIQHVQDNASLFQGDRQFKNVLVIGSTTGYGLASAIAASFGSGAKVLGVGFERNAQKSRTATAGFYNAAEYLRQANGKSHWAKVIMGDAFSATVKEKAGEIIKSEMGPLDLVVYSLAAPVRIHPDTGERYQSVIKPIGSTYRSKNIDLQNNAISEVEIQPATEQETADTVTVMGGDDWQRWIEFLNQNDLLAKNAITVAYSYIGPSLTHPIYKDGTIGMAKRDLKATADNMTSQYSSMGLSAFISVNKALVTQASSSIPVVPLYISMLYDIMKEKGTHEGCIEQMTRMFGKLAATFDTDTEGYLRMDDWEMDTTVQAEVDRRWSIVTNDNLMELADVDGYKDGFLQLFGFKVDGVDYSIDVNEVASDDHMILMN